MKNIPKIIYLNIGEDFSEIADFNDLEGVTWSKEGVWKDMPYCNISVVKKAFEAGKELSEWQCLSGEEKHKPKTFKQWFKEMELGNE